MTEYEYALACLAPWTVASDNETYQILSGYGHGQERAVIEAVQRATDQEVFVVRRPVGEWERCKENLNEGD